MAGNGTIMTVTGEIAPEALGVTLTHEHLHIHAPSFYLEPQPSLAHLIHAPIEMCNLGLVRQHPFSNKSNLSIVDEVDAVTAELADYKVNGGDSIVENTSHGLHRNLKKLKAMSETSGVKIVAGTGFYCENYQQEAVTSYSEEKMAEVIRSDLIDGEDGIKCGIIGEIGLSWPITDFEKRSLRSAATVQAELGRPVNIHPGRDAHAPFEALRIFQEAGGKAGKTTMAHLDRTIFDVATLLEFAEIGTYLEYDLFGMEVSYYPLNDQLDMPSDAQRINIIKALLDNGLEDRILVAHDIYTKHRLVKYGGHGYSHILLNAIPKMLLRGYSQQQVDKILKHNPRNWLTVP